MSEDDPAEDPEGESDDSDDRSDEEERGENTGGEVSPEEPDDGIEEPLESESNDPDESTSPSDEPSEDPSEQSPEPAGDEDELSPEELAEEVLDESEADEPSGDEPSSDDETDEDVEENVGEEPEEESARDDTEDISPEDLAEDVLEDVDTENEESEEPEEDESDDRSDELDEESQDPLESEGDSGEESIDDLLDEETTESETEEELSPEELAESVLEDVDTEDEEEATSSETDDSTEEAEVETESDEEPSPQELADEVLEEPATQDDESEETSSGETELEESIPEQPEEDASGEEPAEGQSPLDEGVEKAPDNTSDESDSVEEGGDPQETDTDEIVDDVLSDIEEAEEESSDEPAEDDLEENLDEGQDELSPEELAESVLEEEEEEEEEPDEPEGMVSEEESDPQDTGDEGDREEVSEESEDEFLDEELETVERDAQTAEPEPSDEDISGEEPPKEETEAASDESDSIQDMLEEEAERAREEEEEELPEGYLTVEQLPEEEEFEVPRWVKTTGWFSMYGLVGLVALWYLFLPLWETFLLNQVKASIDQGQLEDARAWANWGTGPGGYLIKNDDTFRADYLHQLLDVEALEVFPDEYERLDQFDPSPYMDQVFTQYLLNRGDWSRAMDHAGELQRWVRTRGQGYLMHGKAALELGQFEQVEADASRATQWLGDHPGVTRLLRDLRFRQGEYRESLQLSNELQRMIEDNPHWSMKVHDYLQLARANKELGRHRVAQRMLERALDLDPRNEGVLKDLGTQYLLEGRQERAAPMVNGTEGRPGYRELYPLNAFGWWGGSEMAQSGDRIPRSIRMIERAEDLEPRNAEVHRVKGELYGSTLDRPGEAVSEFKRARELGIDRLRLINSLAQAQYRSGQYEGSVEVYSTLRDHVGDTRPDILYNLGSAQLGAGEYERSEELIQRAHNTGYRNQNSFNQWGLSLELQGERQRALAKYVEGIEWGERNNEPIGRVRENLNRALAQDPATPRTEWLAPVEAELGFQPWATLETPMSSDTIPSS